MLSALSTSAIGDACTSLASVWGSLKEYGSSALSTLEKMLNQGCALSRNMTCAFAEASVA